MHKEEERVTCAQTCVPVSGIMVKRTFESSSRTHATFPREDKEAVSSRERIRKALKVRKYDLTRKRLDVPNRSLESHIEDIKYKSWWRRLAMKYNANNILSPTLRAPHPTTSPARAYRDTT
jgi:hypothetical protein